ncbi:hypothetical protein KR084_009879, partial [Drosophila pseudotakahashii]
ENKHKFDGQLDKSGLYVFKANLSDLPQKGNTVPYYDISVEYDGEIYQLQQTFPQMYGSMIDAHNAYFTPRIDVNFFLQIHGRKDSEGYPAPLIAGDEFRVTLNSKDPINYFIYTIVARGLILHTERVELPNPKNVYNFTVKSTHLTSPFFHIYAYYVDDEGILQYTQTHYKVIVSLPNEISISAPNTGYPGEEIDIQIKTEPNSFVGLLAVDERISGKRRLDNIKRDKNWELEGNQILNALAGEERHAESSRNYEIDMNSLDDDLDDFYLHTYKKVPGSRLGLITMTNAKISKRIFRYFDKAMGTWLFTDIKQTKEGVTNLKTKLPEALGTWVITGFSLHPERGLECFYSNVTKIKAFQPYSLSIRLPDSVKLGESISVPVVIINHLPDPLKLQLTMDNETDAYDFIDSSGNKLTNRIQVEEYGAKSVSFRIRPKFTGNFIPLDFTINSSVKNTTIQKTLKVIPESTPKHNNQAILINLTDNQEYKRSLRLDFPKEMVLNSEQIDVDLLGDPLGLIVENLDNSSPSGTGELIMSKMVVNFLVWDHLNETKKLYDTLDSEIKDNLRMGYQNVLNYQHEDGSFSYFGPKKGNGSIWLTSFVLHYLSDIQEIIYIDNSILNKGFEFLIKRQNEDGSFTDDFEYFSRKDSSLFLTSSVLLSLQKAKNPNMEAIIKAVTFIKSQIDEANFSLTKTVAIYALQKSKDTESDKLKVQLKSLVQQKDDRTWWAENVQKRSPQDVEITSYALLSLMESEQDMSELEISTIRWLLAQRNRYGEFDSSQKNVVGLTALIKFAKRIDYKAVDLEVSLSGEDKSDKIVFRHRNDMIVQSTNFPHGTRSLEIQAKGTGTALLQISYQYNSVEKEPNPTFRIQTRVKTTALSSKLQLNVCVDFVEEGEAKTSNLAILEVSLPSGYITVKDSLKGIRDIEGVRVSSSNYYPQLQSNYIFPQLVQTKNEESVVMVYFESLAKNENKCIPIEAFRAFEVTNLKPSTVVIYDNYGRKATEYYQFESEL